MRRIKKYLIGITLVLSLVLSNVSSVYAMTRSEGVQWAKQQIGKYIDMDNAAGAQCMDLIIKFMVDNFNAWPQGNAIDLMDQNGLGGFKVIKDSADFIPKPGDIAVFQTGDIYGHTSIITSLTTSNGVQTGFYSIDQNWVNSSLTHGSAAVEVWHPYYSSGINFVGVLRPPYSDDEVDYKVVWSTGKYKVTKNMYVRNSPDPTAPIVATYYPGEYIEYDSIVYANDRQWVSYYAKGARRYVETIWYNSGNISINSVGYGEDEVIDILPR